MYADDPPSTPSSKAQRLLPPPRETGRLPRALRPREKVLSHGPGRLAATELVALVLGTGTREAPAWKIADRLVRRYGLRGLGAVDARALSREKGVGKAGAARLAAVWELGRRLSDDGSATRPSLTRPADVYETVADLAVWRKECLVGLYLDAQNGLLHRETLSVGALNTTRTHPREIFYPAIEHLALGFILAHNHPSGCLEPSPEDVAFTRAVRQAGEILGIELYDHLIVTRSGYTSLRERGCV